MAAELVNSATSEKLTEMDWMKNIEICELVARDHRQARDVVKAVKKRLGSKNANTRLYTVTLLEMLMNNVGEHIHKQVIDTGVLSILVKIVKKKSDSPVREKIFLLLDATQTSLGGASGKFPQYYTAYYDLVSAGVKFPEGTHTIPSNDITSQSNKNQSSNAEHPVSKHEGATQQTEPQFVPESSIIQKASNALEVLKEVLDAVDTQHAQGAKDEFTLDLVEQCSFQKQRVMHLAMTSRDEKVVSRAIDLNEKLEKVLVRHDALLLGTNQSTALNDNHDEGEEEEEAEQLFRRIQKGKACVRPEDKDSLAVRSTLGLLGSTPAERLNRPLIRPLSLEPSSDPNLHHPQASVLPPSNGPNMPLPSVVIPPPPAKHMERERFFQENKMDASAASGRIRGLSLHSRSASSSQSGSIDYSD